MRSKKAKVKKRQSESRVAVVVCQDPPKPDPTCCLPHASHTCNKVFSSMILSPSPSLTQPKDLLHPSIRNPLPSPPTSHSLLLTYPQLHTQKNLHLPPRQTPPPKSSPPRAPPIFPISCQAHSSPHHFWKPISPISCEAYLPISCESPSPPSLVKAHLPISCESPSSHLLWSSSPLWKVHLHISCKAHLLCVCVCVCVETFYTYPLAHFVSCPKLVLCFDFLLLLENCSNCCSDGKILDSREVAWGRSFWASELGNG